MADYNSVPLGQTGTGSAFVLGESQAANRFLQTVDRNRQLAEQQRILRQKQQYEQAQALADNWNKNGLKAEGGMFWQQEFDKRQQDHLDKGFELRKKGIDAFGSYDVNNPEIAKSVEDYQLERQAILADRDARKAKEDQLSSLYKAYSTNPSKYRSKSFQAINDYVSKPYSEVRNQPVPSLEEGFDVENEFYKVADPVTEAFEKIERTKEGDFKVEGKVMNKAETRKVGENILANNERGKNYILDTIGFPLETLKKIPSTLEGNIKDLVEDYSGDKGIRDELSRQYGVTSLEEAMPFLQQMAQDNFDKKRKYNQLLDSFEERAKAKVDGKTSRLPYFGFRDQALQEQANARAIANQNESSGSNGTPRDINLPYSDGKANVNVKNFVGLTLPAKNFAGSPAYDMKTGQRIPALESSNDYEVVGVGNFPFISKDAKDDKGNNLKGTLAQPKFQDEAAKSGAIKDEAMVHVQQRKKIGEMTVTNDFLVPYERLPENIKNSKSVKQALSSFKPATQQQGNSQNTKTKTVSMSAVMDNYNKNPEYKKQYTKQQFIDWYKGQGITVK